ncbi:MAG: N-acetylmuramoyl-L-alanine amidase [Deltaproteobacteria bacterium]|nr:N-acetylmuramoyl-L-alanine amidase [Deltaproteobacteria bacterium]
MRSLLHTMSIRNLFRPCFVTLLAIVLIGLPDLSEGTRPQRPKSRHQFTPKVIDIEHKLSDCFKLRPRAETRFVIVHTSEAGLESTLRTLSQGKVRGCRLTTCGGHANYAIARNGDVYRILGHRFRADHAGISMWNGYRDVSSYSVGIELIAYHYSTITDSQYRSLEWLLQMLRKAYGIDERDVLTHAQVAYGRPNRWHPTKHRGRKRCAKNFDRQKAGLKTAWTFDPDVRAGRLTKDDHLAEIFYGSASLLASNDAVPYLASDKPVPSLGSNEALQSSASNEALQSNVISLRNTAWNVAGEDYDSCNTVYVLPGGTTLPGDQVEKKLGWSRLPAGTRVLLNVDTDQKVEEGPIKTLEHGKTAWSLAGPNYRNKNTFYFLPDGKVLPGHRVSDWDSLPEHTRMIMGYRGPYTLRQGRHPKNVVGSVYRNENTLYFYPDNKLLSAVEIDNWSGVPAGTRLFVKLN